MTWAISIAVFVGTAFAALAVLWLVQKSELIRTALREHRRETRTPASVAVQLTSRDVPSIRETVATENISRHGARVIAKNSWQPSERVVVQSPRGNAQSDARIAYCNRADDAFSIGLQFSRAVDLAIFFEHSPHPYRK